MTCERKRRKGERKKREVRRRGWKIELEVQVGMIGMWHFPLFSVSCSSALVTYGQSGSQNSKWKILELTSV